MPTQQGSRFVRTLRLLLGNPKGSFGTAVMLLLIAAAILAPLILPTTRWNCTSRLASNHRRQLTGSALMSWAAIFLAASFTERAYPSKSDCWQWGWQRWWE
jgi:hypothetical protein